MNDRDTLKQLHNIATEAIVANQTEFGEIQSSLRGLGHWFKDNHKQAVSVDATIMAWHQRTGATETESVEKLCDILEKEMMGQMDWFDCLNDMVLHWCSELKDTDEYQRYEKSKSSDVDLMPLLRKSNLATVRRIIEEFSPHDFDQMFGWLKPAP